jgi:hypothetical protein
MHFILVIYGGIIFFNSLRLLNVNSLNQVYDLKCGFQPAKIVNRVKRIIMDKFVESFKKTFLALLRFIEVLPVSKGKFACVCDSAPGVGKTTALAAVIKYLASISVKPALLLVFNNTDTMYDFYEDVLNFAQENHKHKLPPICRT